MVNCIILGRAEAFASKNSVGLSALDGLGMGAGFTAALVIMGGIREFLGSGTLFSWPEGGLFPPIAIFVLPAGGFFVFGMLIWLTNKLSKRLEARARGGSSVLRCARPVRRQPPVDVRAARRRKGAKRLKNNVFGLMLQMGKGGGQDE